MLIGRRRFRPAVLTIGLLLGCAGAAQANIEYSRLVGRGCATCHMDDRTPAKDTVIAAGVAFSDCRLNQICIDQWKVSLPPESRPGATASQLPFTPRPTPSFNQSPAPFPAPPPFSPEPHWVAWIKAQPITADAMQGAVEGASTPEYVCRAEYGGGVHPGKVVGGTCYFAYFDKEIGVGVYGLLLGDAHRVFWAAPGANGGAELVPGGREGTKLLPICRVRLFVDGRMMGVEIGKDVDGKCEVGYGGKAYHVDGMEILYQRSAQPTGPS